MPTIPFRRSPMPPPGLHGEEIRDASPNHGQQHLPFERERPSGDQCAGGEADGRPVGMMLIGRQYDDATVLRAAAAFERASGKRSTRRRKG